MGERKCGHTWRDHFREAVARRVKREPVQYIVGSWPFFPLKQEVLVRPPVLIPRPETEELVDVICRNFRSAAEGVSTSTNGPSRLVDVGSGSGIICISLLDQFPHATAVAVEPNPTAAALTKENAKRCGVD